MSSSYAVIGNYQSDKRRVEALTEAVKLMTKNRWILRTGGTKGAEEIAEKICDQFGGKKEVYLPYASYNGNQSPLYDLGKDLEAESMFYKFLYTWKLLNNKTKQLLRRHAYVLFGKNLDDPVRFVIGLSKNSETGMHIFELAWRNSIPVFDLTNEVKQSREQIEICDILCEAFNLER